MQNTPERLSFITVLGGSGTFLEPHLNGLPSMMEIVVTLWDTQISLNFCFASDAVGQEKQEARAFTQGWEKAAAGHHIILEERRRELGL